ncbi:MAG: hypothetical protein WDA16_00315 [Candidatus Thermoplasmatota archaeon]
MMSAGTWGSALFLLGSGVAAITARFLLMRTNARAGGIVALMLALVWIGLESLNVVRGNLTLQLPLFVIVGTLAIWSLRSD